MISIFVLLFILFSFSFFSSVLYNKRFEESILIGTLSVVLILFVVGFINLLKFGVYLVIGISVILYILSIYKIYKERNYLSTIKNLLTPAFFTSLVLLFIFILGLKGKVFETNDEYSHWGDVVKFMSLSNKFGTNNDSGLIFASYPPGLSLFQYFFNKVNCLLSGDIFEEWLCYLSYGVLCINFVINAISKIRFKNILGLVSFVSVIFVCPFLFFIPSFISLHVEVLMAFVSCGIALDLIYSKDDLFSDIRVLLSIAFSVILKDSGLLFALAFTVIYAIKKTGKDNNKHNIRYFVVSLISLIVPKLLWNFNIKLNGTKKVFNGRFELSSFINVLAGKEISYRKEVFGNYVDKLINDGVYIAKTNIFINYLSLFVVLALLIIAVSSLLLKEGFNKKTVYTVSIGFISVNIIYILGLALTYMYSFSESEAIALASFDRYISVSLISMSMFIIISLIILFNESANSTILTSLLLAGMVLIAPMESIVTFASGVYARNSIEERNERYTFFVDKTMDYVDEDSKIYFIDIGSESQNRLAYKFLVRPCVVGGDWSIREVIDEEDDYSVLKTKDEWLDELIDENYDFVAIYIMDNQFAEEYGPLFADEDDIKDFELYQFNGDAKLLELCE